MYCTYILQFFFRNEDPNHCDNIDDKDQAILEVVGDSDKSSKKSSRSSSIDEIFNEEIKVTNILLLYYLQKVKFRLPIFVWDCLILRVYYK